jgi:hypothetical protein
MMLTVKDLKKRKTAPKPRQPKAATDVRRIVERMVSAYMSWCKDNPGGTDGR